MKKILATLVVSLLSCSKSYAEIVKIDCTLKFNNGQVVSNYFELNLLIGFYFLISSVLLGYIQIVFNK